MIRNIPYILRIFIYTFTCLLYGCYGSVSSYTEVNRKPKIDPDYSDITIPPNIAPLNFTIDEIGDKYHVKIHSRNDSEILMNTNKRKIKIPQRKWKDLLEKCAGNDFSIDISVQHNGKWKRYNTITNHIATEKLDKYLVYRIIDPGFEIWAEMGIYQRDIENFNVKPVMINSLSNENCMNCHSFCKNSSKTMLFHMRGRNPGTIVYRNGEISIINTKTKKSISAGVYPSWHPNGRYVAFSVNEIRQLFHAVPDKKVEVVDLRSDLIIYDAETNEITNCEKIASASRFETLPCWSPDGKFLYYCSAKESPVSAYDQIRYDLLRIEFNPETLLFGEVDTIVSSSHTGQSASFPRISPDGKFLLFCMSSYGSFTIWHKESDLYLINLETNEIIKPEINSNQTESYHSWSSTGRWIVFSSRRADGLFTRPFFSYFDSTGFAHKPFILPQKDPEFYGTFLKSYNLPELVLSPVEINPREISKAAGSLPMIVSSGNDSTKADKFGRIGE